MDEITRAESPDFWLAHHALFNGLIEWARGIAEASPAIRAKLDQDLVQLGKEALHQRLTQIDPLACGENSP